MSNNKDFIIKNALEVGKDTKTTLGTITSSDVDLSTGNYFAETLAADTTYTFSNAGDVQAFQLEVTGGAIGYDVSSASYDIKSYDVTAQDTDPRSLAFSSDGTKMYVSGSQNNRVYEYDLSTAWDVSTTSYSNVFLSYSAQATSGYGLAFKTDGTEMYVMCQSTGSPVVQYTLSTAWDLSTASYSGNSFNTSLGAPSGVFFKSDGTKMYTIDYVADDVRQYSLSTAWDVSTASYDSVNFSVASQDTTPFDLTFSSDGTKMFVAGITTNEAVYQYSLSTAWDLSTASYDSVLFDVSSQDTNPEGVFFKSDGTKMYVLTGTLDVVYQYTTTTDTTLTWPSSVEWTAGVAPSAPGNGETDVYTFVTDDGGTSYVGLQSADNLS